MRLFVPVYVSVIAACFGAAPPDARKIPPGMHPVKPVSSASSSSAADLRIARGQYFSYALPEGWRVGEDGQFALTIVSPDNKAIAVLVGNAGYPPNYSPARFVYEKLMALRPENLQIGQPRPASPVGG